MTERKEVTAPTRTHEKGGGPLNENGLTIKQQLFVDHYIVTLNACEAARRAGYTGDENTIGTVAWENMQKPAIISLLSKRLKRVVEKAEKKVIDVYDEFVEQLEFAKRLRTTADAYLSDPDDPFQLVLGPQAHEIDILYYDFNDLDDEGKPKKKKSKLNQLLAELAGRAVEAYRVEMKGLDIRKFALDAVSTADMCIDKFARMGGSYQKDKKNEADASELIEALTDRLISKGWERAKAREVAEHKYGGGQPLQLTS